MRCQRNTAVILLLWQGLSAFASPFPNSTKPNLDERSFYINPAVAGAFRPWPSSSVEWCIEADSNNEALVDLMLLAWSKWVAVVGGPQKSSLSMHYAGLCESDTGGDFLHVSLTDARTAGTTTGWQGAGYTDGRKAKNRMDFDMDGSWGTGNAASNLAHELGHAFGLFHEHQRSIAWQSPENRPYRLLKFTCENLKDYADQKNAGGDMKTLCTSMTDAKSAGFSAGEFLPYPGFTAYSQSPNFDWKSIMLYSSYAGAKTVNGQKQPTMVDYNDVLIQPNLEPSSADADAVRQIYPPA